MDESHFNLLIDETAAVFKPDGTLLCKVMKRKMNPDWIRSAYGSVKDIKLSSRNRGNAAGEPGQKYLREDGVVSNTTIAEEVESGVLGYLDRNPRRPYCRACSWNLNNPERFAAMGPMFREVSELFKQEYPERYEIQKSLVDNSSPDFVIPGTVFTTITINRNFRTAAHMDAGNFKEGFSLMNVIREGRWSGADLVFPDFGVATRLDTGDLILFDPQEFHGNTELICLTKNAVRMSLVYYYRENIRFCGTAVEELKRVRNRKRGETLGAT